jgi:hypothetical protein
MPADSRQRPGIYGREAFELGDAGVLQSR